MTGWDSQIIQGIEVLNTNRSFCTVDKKQKSEDEYDVWIFSWICSPRRNHIAGICRFLRANDIDFFFSILCHAAASKNTYVGLAY